MPITPVAKDEQNIGTPYDGNKNTPVDTFDVVLRGGLERAATQRQDKSPGQSDWLYS